VTTELLEVEVPIWKTFLNEDGRMRRAHGSVTQVKARTKIRSSGYRSERVLGPAAENSRVKELMASIDCVKKEDLILG